MRVAWVLAIAALGLAVADMFFRDPCIDLGLGYALVATSPASPLELVYEPGRDTRTYSPWKAAGWTMVDGVMSPKFELMNLDEGELREFESEAEWRAAAAAVNAAPFFPGQLASGVTEYQVFGSFLLARTATEFLIVDMGANVIQYFDAEAQWRQAGVERCGTFPGMRSATWAAQIRRPLTYVIVVVIPAAIFLAYRAGRGVRIRR